MKISIIGAGRVGSCLALLLNNDFEIVGISGRDEKQLKKLQDILNSSCYFGNDNVECARKGDIIFITTPDDFIEKVATEIFRNHDIKNKYVFHCSGCNPSSLLNIAKKNNCYIGSIHPLQTVPNIEKGIENLKKAYFCIEGDEEAVKIAQKLVKAISGKHFVIKTEYKYLYHLGAVFSSNFVNSLVFTTCELYKKIGIAEDYNKIVEIILPLLKGALNGIESIGIINSLTGPIVRGDIQTVNKHLKAIEKDFPQILNLYIELSKQTIKLALKQVDKDKKSEIENINLELEKVYGNKSEKF